MKRASLANLNAVTDRYASMVNLGLVRSGLVQVSANHIQVRPDQSKPEPTFTGILISSKKESCGKVLEEAVAICWAKNSCGAVADRARITSYGTCY